MAVETQATTEQQTWLWRGYQIRYSVVGSGQPLILVHGFGGGASAFQWRRNLSALSAHYCCYTLDLLGYGASDQPALHYRARIWLELIHDFTAMVTESDSQQRCPHVIAALNVAAYVLALAAQHPQTFDNLILLMPVGLTTFAKRPGIFQAVSYALLARTPLGRLIYQLLLTEPAIKRNLRSLYFNKSEVTPELVHTYAQRGRTPNGHYPILAFLLGRANQAVGNLLWRITNPTLIIWGEQAFLDVRQADEYVRRMPNARLHIIQNAGILANDEAATEFNQVVLDFLER